MRTLSKSKLMAYRQCHMKLWLDVYQPQTRDDSSDVQRHQNQGHRVGELARRLYDPEQRGTVLDGRRSSEALAQTQMLLSEPRPIFEATLSAGGARFSADVLLPEVSMGSIRWRLVEVKSTKHWKKHYVDDVAIQAFVAKAARLPLTSISVAHLDGNWTYAGTGDYRGLLKEVDVTEEAVAREHEVAGWIDGAQAVLGAPQPTVRTGRHCEVPHVCGFKAHCDSLKPKSAYPVDWLPNVRKELKAHIADGAQDMTHIPDNLLDTIQLRVKTSTTSGDEFFDRPGARAELSAHGFPAYFLDFETVNLAVPIWEGARPYQRTPFQFSIHRLSSDGNLKKFRFLDLSGQEPSRKLAEALIAACETEGPVYAYTSVESSVIKDLAGRHTDLSPSLAALAGRIVDLHKIALKYYYHPKQQGSWGLKTLLPAIAPNLSYTQLNGVKDGEMAGQAFLEAIDLKTSPERREQLREQLTRYCDLDVAAMIHLWRLLLGETKPFGACTPAA